MEHGHNAFLPPYLAAAGLIGALSGALTAFLSDPAAAGLRGTMVSAFVTLVVAVAGYVARRLNLRKDGLTDQEREHIAAAAREAVAQAAVLYRARKMQVPTLEPRATVVPAAPSAPSGILGAVSNAAASAPAGSAGFARRGALALCLVIALGPLLLGGCASFGQPNATGASVAGVTARILRWVCGTALPVVGPYLDNAAASAPAPANSGGSAAPAAVQLTDELLAPRAVPQR